MSKIEIYFKGAEFNTTAEAVIYYYQLIDHIFMVLYHQVINFNHLRYRN